MTNGPKNKAKPAAPWNKAAWGLFCFISTWWKMTWSVKYKTNKAKREISQSTSCHDDCFPNAFVSRH